MKIQGNYINVNGGQLVTEPIQVKFQVLTDRIKVGYYLADDFDSMKLCVEELLEGMVYDEEGNELGIKPIRTRKYLPAIILGVFDNPEQEILNRINAIK